MNQKESDKTTEQADSQGISLWVDDYGDIFSDFDPRRFNERAISDDFLMQVRKVCKESRGKIMSLRILVPHAIQNVANDKVIRKRIEDHFATVYETLVADARAVRLRSIYLILSGLVCMLGASYLRFLDLSGFYINLVLVLFEPGGWFLFWTGSDQLVNYSRKEKADKDFYRKMSTTHVEFRTYT